MHESDYLDELTQIFYKQVCSFYRRPRIEDPNFDVDERALNLARIDVNEKATELAPAFGGEAYGSLSHFYIDALNFKDYSAKFQNVDWNIVLLYTLKCDVDWLETYSAEVLYMLSRIRRDLWFVDDITESHSMMSPDLLIPEESMTAEMRDREYAALVLGLTRQLKNETPFLIRSIEHFSRSYFTISEILLRYKCIIDEFVSVPEEKWNDIDFAITIRSLQVLFSSLSLTITQSWPAILVLTSEEAYFHNRVDDE